MKLGFSTLALFMKSNDEILETARKKNFEMIELLAEEPFYQKENNEIFRNCGFDIRMHAPTVDLNIASLNTGIRRESVNQMVECGQYAEKIGVKTITIHPGKIGRIDSRIRKYALEMAVESIGEIIDCTNIEVSVENMPVRKSFLANTTEELERIQTDTGCYLTIDTGHANTCGNLQEMLELKNISYCHLHDNDGEHDQHKPLGEGTLNLDLLRKIDYGILENSSMSNILRSKSVIDSLYR